MKFLKFFWRWFVRYPPNSTVVLVDMQPNFVKAVRHGRAAVIIEHQRQILRKCAREDIPVIVLEYENEGSTIKELTDALQYVPRSVVISKSRNSGFTNPELETQLQKFKTEAILFMGINAAACVKVTAEHAIDCGFEIMTSVDLIAGQYDHPRDDAIDWYRRNGRVII